ncbi:CDP-glycerol glycerophosphotransferase family protein [Lentibacillus sp. N15]|uniref:CDP-glycerol glycerophosphotransferase family protein n=1 Tax=Lentibacillus songyuanensis TaxID=3136161 RepID=UPI0031B9DD90
MFREWIITGYLLLFQLVFQLFRILPLQRKITLVATFGDNIVYTIRTLEKKTGQSFVIVKTPKCAIPFSDITSHKVLDLKSPTQWIASVYHLATSRIIFVDNYLGMLAKMKVKPQVLCIQLWHAAGAIKRFGLEDPAYQTRSTNAQKRIKAVYQRITHVVIGSEKMAPIFQQSFCNPELSMLRCGIPRTDFFFRPIEMKSVELVLHRKYPVTQEKKIVLYAPTFRDHNNADPHIPIDVDQFCDAFCDDYVLFLRLHPAIKHNFHNKYPGVVYDVSDVKDVSKLLVLTDILITDYSSIPFEFAILERPMIFFAYDLAEYQQTRGFWEDYEMLVPGPVVMNSEQLIKVMQAANYDFAQIRTFAATWNQYSNGHSSDDLVKEIVRNL